MEEYLHWAMSLALALRGARKPMDDDFIFYILKGLGYKFDPIVAALNACHNFPSLEAVIGKLRDFELRLSAAHEISYASTLYTNHVASTQNNNHGNHSSRSQKKYKDIMGVVIMPKK